MSWNIYDTIRAHFLEVGDVISHDGVIYTILDIAEDDHGYRITAQDDVWDETHELLLEDEQIVGLAIAE
jgi:hypothetical protein